LRTVVTLMNPIKYVLSHSVVEARKLILDAITAPFFSRYGSLGMGASFLLSHM
jgi:hypothetical protein